jgi:esterase/lipase
MSMFINQMLGCLIIAAGIGGAVGWLLRNVSAGKLTQQLADVTAMMHLKEQMLEKARHELRHATSKLQAIESPVTALQAEDNEALKAAYTQAVAENIDKAA